MPAPVFDLRSAPGKGRWDLGVSTHPSAKACYIPAVAAWMADSLQ
jgi:hypothetical protein